MNGNEMTETSMSSSSINNNERVAYLDVLRVIATFGIIFVHVMSKDYHLPILQYDWYVAVVSSSTVRWSVPVFVMISGVLFLNPRKHITIRKILTKYVPRLVIAYLFWYVIYNLKGIILLILINQPIPFEWGFYAPEFHLWFLPMLVGVYLLIPCLRKITESEKLILYTLYLWLGYITISFILLYKIPQISELFTMNIIIGYAGYFLLGYYLSIIPLSKKQQRIVYFWGFLGVTVTIVGSLAWSIHQGVNDEMFFNHLSPHVIMMSACIFVMIKNNAARMGKKTKSFIEYVRKDLFGIYLVHSIWLWLINRSVFRDLSNHLVTELIITLVIFVCSLYSTKIIRSIPILRKVVE